MRYIASVLLLWLIIFSVININIECLMPPTYKNMHPAPLHSGQLVHTNGENEQKAVRAGLTVCLTYGRIC